MAEGWQLVLLAGFIASIGAFFAWLGNRVVDMGGRIIGIEKDIKSLLGTREEQKAEKQADTGKRLDVLKGKK